MKLAETILALVARLTRDVDVSQVRSDVESFAARHAGLTRRGVADRMIVRTARRAAALGAAASLPPGWGALAAMGPELTTLIWLQSRLILGLHLLYGLEPDPVERSREVLAGLAAGVGIRTGRALGTRAAVELAERLAVRVLRREGTHLIPVAGVAAGALLNYAGVKAVGRAVLARIERRTLPGTAPLLWPELAADGA